jgi:hypothetical protein
MICGVDRPRKQFEVEVPPRDLRHQRQRLPAKVVLQDRCLSPRRPGAVATGTLAQPAFVDEDDRLPVSLGLFFNSCHAALPPADGGLVAFPGTASGPLRCDIPRLRGPASAPARCAGGPRATASVAGQRGAPPSTLGVPPGPTAWPSGSPTADAPQLGAPLRPPAHLVAAGTPLSDAAALTSLDPLSLRLDVPYRQYTSNRENCHYIM